MNKVKQAISHLITLWGLLKSNLLYHQWLLKESQESQSKLDNPHDEKCAFYPHLLLLSLPGPFDVKYTILLPFRFLLLER